MTPVLAFDIETMPDMRRPAAAVRARPRAVRHEVAEIAFQRRRTAGEPRFPAAAPAARGRHLLRPARSATASASGRWARPEDSEAELIRRFFDGIEKYTPQLVSWNGGGFDLPVLHYRGLIHGIPAPRYWDMGEDDRDFKWNNYISRYHTRHLDLMDLLALYQPRANAPLDELAKLMRLSRQARHGRLAGLGRLPATARSTTSAITARPTSPTPIWSTCASS